MASFELSMREITRAIKLKGLTLQSKAVKAIERTIKAESDPKESLDTILESIKQHLDANPSASRIITEDTVSSVIADCTKMDEDVEAERFQLLNAMETPKLVFHSFKKQFTLENVVKGSSLHSGPQAKVAMLRERFLLVQQRIQRHEFFCRPLVASANKTYVELTTIDMLLGGGGENRYLLGMLCEVEENNFYLEDLNGQVQLNLSGVEITTGGLFMVNCVVVAEGCLVDGIFHVERMGSPPPEPRATSLETIGAYDLFRTGITPQQWMKVSELEKQANDAMFVIISDIHLDKPQVMEKLKMMFDGYQYADPLPLFIFIGNFSSKPYTSDGIKKWVDNFNELGNLIAEYPNIAEEGRFVFVPGPKDPGASGALPRAKLSHIFTKEFSEKVRHASFATNPCRLRFYAQEIVIFREDLLKKMMRHQIAKNKHSEDSPSMEEMTMHDHLIETVLDQAHLCPLPLTSRPVHWEFDHTLRLYPMPDVLVLADHTQCYSNRYVDCNVINPGSFHSDFNFVVYRPSVFETDFSKI